MQLRGNEQTATVGGMTAKRSQEFRFAMNDRMFEVFSSSIYQNKIRAIIREICTNALDAHISVSKKDTPFEVQIPTSFEPILRVRDFGTGLSEEQIYDIYTVYFESTKGGSNDEVGGYGLGTKSPLSYVDAFQIRSYQNGVLKTYTCYKNGKTPKTDLVFEGATNEPDGLEVSMAINSSDINRFEREAGYVLSTFDVKPDCYEYISSSYKFELVEQDAVHGIFAATQKLDEKFYIKMGPVMYPLTVDMKEKIDTSLWWSLLKNGHNSMVFMAEIGEYDIPPSRENIDNTKHNLTIFEGKLEQLNKVYSDFLEQLKVDVSTMDDARKIYKHTRDKCVEQFGDTTGKSLHSHICMSQDFKVRSIEGHDILLDNWRQQFRETMRKMQPKMRYRDWTSDWKTYALSHSGRNDRFPTHIDEGLTVFLVKGAYTDIFEKYVSEIKKHYNINTVNTVNENSEDTIKFLEMVYGDDLKLVYMKDMLKDIGHEKEIKSITRTQTVRGTKQHDVVVLQSTGKVNQSMSINDVEDVDTETYFILRTEGMCVNIDCGSYICISGLSFRQFLDFKVIEIPSQLEKAVERNSNFVHVKEILKDWFVNKLKSRMWDKLIVPAGLYDYNERFLLNADLVNIKLVDIDSTAQNYDELKSLVRFGKMFRIPEAYTLDERIDGLEDAQQRLIDSTYKKYPLIKRLGINDLREMKDHVKLYMNAVDQQHKEEI